MSNLMTQTSTVPLPIPGEAVRLFPSASPGDVGKRAMDLMFSAILLVGAMPFMAAIAILVRLSSPGPIFFRHRRLGLGGREFWCYKFRTMVADAEAQLQKRSDLRQQFDANFKIKDDPRVTPFGAFLRKSSLDELPQLWNVLVGDLSLIGPRPIVPRELAKYGQHGRTLLTVKPGLGGIWQVYGRSDTTYEQRIAMDIHYVENRSLRLDFRLLAQTAWVVLRGRGAY